MELLPQSMRVQEAEGMKGNAVLPVQPTRTPHAVLEREWLRMV